MTDEPTDIPTDAMELLALAHEQAKKPLVAVDIRTGNIGRMGVKWVETTTALSAIEAALRATDPALKECVEALEELQAEFCEYHCGTSISGLDHEPDCDRARATLAAMTKEQQACQKCHGTGWWTESKFNSLTGGPCDCPAGIRARPLQRLAP